MRRRARVLLVVAAVLLATVVAGAYMNARDTPVDPDARRADAARLMNDLMSGNTPVGAPFTLADETGRRVSLADFRGKVVVLYFGYMFCPDVCPTDLLTIATVLKTLGAEAQKVQPVFVTLDPGRDKPAELARFVKSFSPRFVALRGSEAETREVATAYKVFYEKVLPPGSGQYVIDHTAFTFIVDAEGQYAGFFPPGTGADRMTLVVRDVLAAR